MSVVWFIAGMVLGGFIGVCAMCLFIVSGRESAREDERNGGTQ